MAEEERKSTTIQNLWQREKFPQVDLRSPLPNHIFKGRTLTGTSDHWKSKKKKPYCWTPVREFHFGGKTFIIGYPCAAWETTNFGYVAQKLWDTVVIGRE